MTSRTETIPHLTCDNCGKQQSGPGIVGWWRLDQHPDGVDFAPLNRARPPFDLCSWACVLGKASSQLFPHGLIGDSPEQPTAG